MNAGNFLHIFDKLHISESRSAPYTLYNEFRCLQEDLEPSDHISNESKSVGRQVMVPDFIEISKHIA